MTDDKEERKKIPCWLEIETGNGFEVYTMHFTEKPKHTDEEFDEQCKRIIELHVELDRALRAADKAIAVAEKLESRIKELGG